MPSPLSADRSAAPARRGAVDALISQTRRLRGEMDAVRREAPVDGTEPEDRWQRALCDLAMHQLDDLDTHLEQLRDGPPPVPADPTASVSGAGALPAASPHGALLSRVGSAEWNLLTDEASWSGEMYRILGRAPTAPPLTLDELPSLVVDEDRPMLTAMVTDCLVDAKPIDGEFRVRRSDGGVRTVHMMGEPVLAPDGSTASMWAVLRDVSELRVSQRTVRESHDSLRRRRDRARAAELRAAAELREALLPPPRGLQRPARREPGALDLAAHCLTSSAGSPVGGDWYDVLELPDGQTVLGVGDLTGHGVAVASGMATLLGALRGTATAGIAPGRLLGTLNRLVDVSARPALGSALCARYRPGTRTLTWAQAGHPAPLLFRDGTGRLLSPPRGVLLGAAPGTSYGQADEVLERGDLLVLHTDGLVSGHGGPAAVRRLLGLAPRLCAARTAQDCLRTVVEEFGDAERADDACVLVARIG
ncbi:SpoIIE family protein phosphatase [Streptomyces sp. NPDC008313]|uniref:SpoIIE family protein phosphatase n=1 Tax=Streptomyces sp. NPDC008313 TaxID=3364826 RepID=UPI0036ED1C5E